MTDLGLIPLGTLVVAALLVGVSKTAISGVGALSVALFAAVLPARESTGALLPLLLVGDVLAVRAYRRHTDWPALLRLLPSVAVGIVLGVVFVAKSDDTVVRRTIGALLLTIVLQHLWQRWRSGHASDTRDRRSSEARNRRVSDARNRRASEARNRRSSKALSRRSSDARSRRAPDIPVRWASDADPGGRLPTPAAAAATGRQRHTRALLFGLVAGFATMVANAGGPAMSLYLLSSGFTVLGFLGTGAWFFLLVNLVKLPFSVALGLITPGALALDAALALAVLAGALIGRVCVHRIDQALFERLVLLFTALSSLNLLR